METVLWGDQRVRHVDTKWRWREPKWSGRVLPPTLVRRGPDGRYGRPETTRGRVRAVPAFSPEVRRVMHSTHVIASLDTRLRRAARARGHFPNEHAALECLYLTIRPLDPFDCGRNPSTA